MIGELTDKEILEFLMTSDFNDKLSPDEAKFLLLKFRYFYRQTSAKNDLLVTDNFYTKRKLEEQDMISKLRIEDLAKENKTLFDELDTLKNRKLTIMERISGKIIIKNEPK